MIRGRGQNPTASHNIYMTMHFVGSQNKLRSQSTTMTTKQVTSPLLILLVATLCCCRHAIGSTTRSAKETPILPSALIVNDSESRRVALPNKSNVFERGVRRNRSTKPKDSGSKEDKDSKEHDQTASAAARQPQPSTGIITIKGAGLTMKLGGVDPLNPGAIAIWEDVTRDFIEEDIMTISNELNQLDVTVHFVSQYPPFERAKRRLEISGVHLDIRPRSLLGVPGRTAEITFDVGIAIDSEVANPNVNIYVAHAFNSDPRKTVYMRRLLATENAAFADIGSISVDPNLGSVETQKDAKKIGSIVGFAVMGFACIAIMFSVLFGMKSNASNDDEDKDQGSPVHTKTVTATSSSDDDEPAEPANDGIPASVTADDGSYYYDGNVSVTWSMDTDVPHTPRITNNKLSLLGGSSRESSDSSLYADDGIESPVVTPRLEAPHVVTPPRDRMLYEV